MTAAIELDGVVVRAGPRVLLALPRLRIEPGERVALLGPNGAGKSTLLRLLAGQLAASEGQVRVRGQDPAAHGPQRGAARRRQRRDTGLLMQGLHLVPRLSALENVLVGALGRLQGWEALCSLWGRYPAAEVAAAEAALAALGLAGRRHTRTDRLSGGERQKLALARLQLQRPRLVLADEPTAALDPAATAQVCAALQALVQAPGHTLVTVVHDPALLPQLATRVLALAGGRLRWDLPLAAVTPPRLQALYAAGPAEPAGTETHAAAGLQPPAVHALQP